MQAEIQRRTVDANATPAKQIVNHYQTIVNPPLPIPAVPISDGGLTAFQQALMQNNHTLGKTLERMGMSMAEFVEHMKEKDKKAVRDPIIADGVVAPKPEIIPPELIPVDPAPPQPPRVKSRSRSAAKVLPPKPQIVPPELIPDAVLRSESPKAKQELARDIARKELNRSRSRGADVVPPDLLPIEEEEPQVRRETDET